MILALPAAYFDTRRVKSQIAEKSASGYLAWDRQHDSAVRQPEQHKVRPLCHLRYRLRLLRPVGRTLCRTRRIECHYWQT